MKAGWELKTLAQISTAFGRGKSRHRPRNDAILYGGAYPFIQTGDIRNADHFISEFSQTYSEIGLAQSKLWPKGTICITIAANIAETGILEFDACFPDSVIGVAPNPKLADVGYVEYLLQAFKDRLQARGQGSAQANINVGTFEDEQFPFPCVAEQKRIVLLLDEAFDGIATARAHAEKNLQNARAIFESHLQSVFAAGESVLLSDLATDISEGDHMPPPKSLQGVPFITIGNIAKDTRKIDFSDTFMVSRTYFDGLKANKKPQVGDVLYTVTVSFGVPVLVSENHEFFFQRHIGLVRPKSDVSSEWLYYLLMSPQIVQQANDGATGTAQKTVSLKVLRGYQVPRVALPMQLAIVTKLDSLLAETQRLESLYRRKLTALDELKKSLLHQAFSGQLTSAKQTRVPLQAALQTTTPEFTASIICLAHARHERQKREKTFGRVKEQKVLHLVESIARIDLGRHPMKDAAGPNDFQHMLKAEEWAKAHGFFEMVKRPDGGYDFKKLSAFDAHLSRARQALAPYLPQLESIIDLLVPMDKEEAEVFATVHAAWNNLLIDGLAVTDDAIMSAAREGWHPDKLDIPKDKFRTAIALIRQKNLVPDGTAKYVGGQQQLL